MQKLLADGCVGGAAGFLQVALWEVTRGERALTDQRDAA